MNSAKPNQAADQYAAVFIFATTIPTLPDDIPLYEEEVVLIEASSEEEAKSKAYEYAKGQEGSYKNGSGETVLNTFKALVDIQLMQPQLEHGATLYARHFRDYDAYAAFEPLLNGQAL